jgi:hypothetical protein
MLSYMAGNQAIWPLVRLLCTDRQTDRQTDTHTYTCLHLHVHASTHACVCIKAGMCVEREARVFFLFSVGLGLV